MPAPMKTAQLHAFLDEQHVGILVTTNEDGTPNPVPIWYIRRDDDLIMQTGAGSLKARNIGRDARVSLCVQQETLPYKSAALSGSATISGPDADLRRAIAVRYLGEQGADAYLRMSGDEDDSITITLRPERTFSQDFSLETAAAQA